MQPIHVPGQDGVEPLHNIGLHRAIDAVTDAQDARQDIIDQFAILVEREKPACFGVTVGKILHQDVALQPTAVVHAAKKGTHQATIDVKGKRVAQFFRNRQKIALGIEVHLSNAGHERGTRLAGNIV